MEESTRKKTTISFGMILKSIGKVMKTSAKLDGSWKGIEFARFVLFYGRKICLASLLILFFLSAFLLSFLGQTTITQEKNFICKQ